MKLLPRIVMGLAGCLLALGVSAAEAPSALHACKDSKGDIVYQDDPCDAPVVRKVAVPVPRPARVTAPPPTRAFAWAPPSVPAPVPASKSVTQYFGAPPLAGRWASPDRTLQTFVGAVRSGDRALAVQCLTSSAVAELGTGVESAPWETLRRTVDAFTGFVVEGDLGPYWSIRALRGKTRPKWIFFEKSADGTWKISAI
jgi:hypothetical protein